MERSNELGSLLTGDVSSGPTMERYFMIEAEPQQAFSLTAAAAAGNWQEHSRPGEIISLLVVKVVQAISIDRRGEPKPRREKKPRRQAGESDEEYAARVAGQKEGSPAVKEKKTRVKAPKKPKPEPGEDPADYQARVDTWKAEKEAAK